jgi:small multidrug resistance pump
VTTWLWLAGAILSEVSATISLKLSDGFTKLVPGVVVVVGYGASFVMLAQALKRGMPVGVAYSVWAAVGVALIAAIGVVFLRESLTWVQVAGLGLVIAGVVAIQSGSGVH